MVRKAQEKSLQHYMFVAVFNKLLTFSWWRHVPYQDDDWDPLLFVCHSLAFPGFGRYILSATGLV